MAIHRETLQCLTCGQKTVTRTTIGGDDYQDCEFPCPKCGIEITYRLMLYLNTRMRQVTATGLSWQEAMKLLKDTKIKEMVNIANARSCEEEANLPIRNFSERLLNPLPEEDFVSPFLSTVFLPVNPERFMLHQRIREVAATKHWKSVRNLLTHLERKQWDLFDKQWQLLERGGDITSESNRIKAAFRAIEEWEKVFAPGTDGIIAGV